MSSHGIDLKNVELPGYLVIVELLSVSEFLAYNPVTKRTEHLEELCHDHLLGDVLDISLTYTNSKTSEAVTK